MWAWIGWVGWVRGWAPACALAWAAQLVSLTKGAAEAQQFRSTELATCNAPVKPRPAANFLISSLVPGSWNPNCAVHSSEQAGCCSALGCCGKQPVGARTLPPNPAHKGRQQIRVGTAFEKLGWLHKSKSYINHHLSATRVHPPRCKRRPCRPAPCEFGGAPDTRQTTPHPDRLPTPWSSPGCRERP